MAAPGQVRIDLDAARALAAWKSLFGTEVCEGAKRLAAQAGYPHNVTLLHDRTAAKIALEVLSREICGEHGADGRRDAA